MVTYGTTLKFSDIICTKLGRNLDVLLLVGVSCIIVCISSTIIHISYLVHQWYILRYSTYLVRVTANLVVPKIYLDTATKLGRDLVVLLLADWSLINIFMPSTMIPISSLVYQWCILRYSTYLVRVTAIFGSTVDLTGYRYKARPKSDYFTLGWLILY